MVDRRSDWVTGRGGAAGAGARAGEEVVLWIDGGGGGGDRGRGGIEIWFAFSDLGDIWGN